MGKEKHYRVYEFDFVKKEKLGDFLLQTSDINAAREVAIEAALQWCEDEFPKLISQTEKTHEVCIGDADFGALIEVQPESFKIKMICCYCKEQFGEKDGGARPGLESHGVCEDCLPGVLAEIEKAKEKMENEKRRRC